jgi:AbrB family looped-hinge helix DNA binding protein
MSQPEGKRFYGSVTVSERGQIVIPAEARRDFNIRAGDKLLVLGDFEQGIAFTTFDLMSRNIAGAAGLFREIGRTMGPESAGKAQDE